MTATSSTRLPLDRIVVEERTRTDLGDIDDLAESIALRGMLHPIVVRPARRAADGSDEYVLVAGARRLAAALHLGWDSVAVTIAHAAADELAALAAEGEENVCRKPFTPEEAVRHADRRRDLVKARAKEQHRSGSARGGRAEGVSNLDKPSPLHTRREVAKGTGLSATTLDKATAVVRAAASHELPGPVVAAAKAAVAEMNRTGKVDAAHRAVQQAQTQAVIDVAIPAGSDAAEEQRRLNLLAAFHRLTLSAYRGVFALDPDLVGSVLADDGGEERDLDEIERRAVAWVTAAKKAYRSQRSGLRVLEGGRA